MSSFFKTLSALLIALLISTNIFAAKITITMGGDDERAMREHYRYALDWAEENGHEIAYVYRPASATDTLNLYQQICSSGSSDIDIFENGNLIRIKDENLASRWLNYHDSRAQYRMLCRPCNSHFGSYGY